MDWTVRGSDIAIVIATGVGPVLAVQAQKWIEGAKAIRDRRLTIFRTLMATRATRLSGAHVEALNAVPVEFYGARRRLKPIQDDWHAYQDLLGNKQLTGEVLAVKRNDAFMDMLHKMSTYLGYRFSRSELEKDVYYPTGHAEIESEQTVIRQGLAKLFSGEIAIPMAVKEFPTDQAYYDRQEEIARLLGVWLAGESSVKVVQS